MQRRPPIAVAAVLVAVARLSPAASTAEQSLRDLDAEWVRAAQAHSVDGWMSFYADDALILPPNEAAASNRAAIRQSIAGLLELPGLAIEWHPTRIEVSAAGDMAALAGAYALSYSDGHGARVADHGKLVEVWRRYANGAWKCVIDTWNSDLPATAAGPANPGPAPAPAAVSPVAPAGAAPAAAASAATTITPPLSPTPGGLSPAQIQGADYGEAPQDYPAAIRQYFRKVLRSPDTVRYREITAPQKGYTTTVQGVFVAHPTYHFGWTVNATIDAQNSFGAYVGDRTWVFLFRGDRIVGTIAPPAEDEVN